MYSRIFVSFFFLQAEDGIRVGHVTGVQTCALPISAAGRWRATLRPGLLPARRRLSTFLAARRELETGTLRGESRSEERRVGKEGTPRWAADQERKGGHMSERELGVRDAWARRSRSR